MKRFFWIYALLAILLSACAAPQTATPAPVSTATEEVNSNPNAVVASGTVEPVSKSDLAMVISAPVKEILVNEGDVVQAGQSLLTLSSPELEYGLTQAEAALRAAEFRHEYWIPARFDRPPERRQLAEAVYIAAQKQFETAQVSVTQATLTAPFDGTIISVNVSTGELVQPGQILITIADLNSLQIETTDLSERDIPSVQLGQGAQVYIEALDAELHGTVTSISPIAEEVGGDVVYRVTVTLVEQPEGLRWGMNVEVEISQ
ncbi:MAG: efflux RND transporter periplasmic adaptor subunit [Chloroflexota bacterium]